MAFYYGLVIYYLFGFFFLKKNVSKRTKRRYVFWALLPAFLLVAFRSVSVGNDTYTYYDAFEKYRARGDFEDIMSASLREPGFLLLNYMCIKLGRSYTFMQVLISAFTYFSLYRFISRYSEDTWLSCLLFLLNRHMFGTMNAVRMWLAIAIVLFAVPYVIERKIVPVIIITLIAMQFHFTAIVFFPVYFLADIKWNSKRIWISVAITCVISLLHRPFSTLISRIINRYSNYLEGKYFDSGGAATYVNLVMQVCFFMFVFSEYKKWQRYHDIYKVEGKRELHRDRYEGYLFSSILVILLFGIFGLSNTIMSRISAYYLPSTYLSIPYSLLSSNAKNRKVLSILIVTFLLLNFVVVMKYRPGWYGVSKYSFFWESSYR